jgi:ring-1,2-phenylacetyl-CoA epoxidase subunit PaaD
MVTEERVWAALAGVPDPELPAVSVVDLGIVRAVVVEGERVRVELTPTFLGCPALDAMRADVAERVRDLGGEPEVAVVHEEPWSSDRITPAGREKLRAAGIAPPAGRPTLVQLRAAVIECPHCGSDDTRLENLFGATACRSIRWCAACRQPFEAFKPL